LRQIFRLAGVAHGAGQPELKWLEESVYSFDEFRRKLKQGHHFVGSVLASWSFGLPWFVGTK
jgi:hypothetical protein